jgi:hypothetical protein
VQGLGLRGQQAFQPTAKGLVSLLSKFNARARVRPKAGEVLGCGVCNSADPRTEQSLPGRACLGWCARFRVRQGVQYSTGSGGFSGRW